MDRARTVRADRIIAKARDWDDFVRRVGGLKTTKEQGDAFERVTQLYLQTEPEYVAELKSVWLLEEVPKKVRTRLNLPGPDEGIDLIAETRRGTYWSIQAKYRTSKSSALTKTDLSSFSTHSFVHCKNIEFGLVSHTTLKPIRKRHLLGNIGELGLATWSSLSKAEWKRLRDKIDLKPLKLTKRKPRKHQRAAIRAAKKHYVDSKASRGRIIMPCGTGKSLTAYWIARELKARRVLIAVPSLSLIRQSLKDWTREYLAAGQVPEWLCVCSSEDVGRVDQDEFVGQTYDLGVPTTTDPAEIASFLASRSRKPKIVFTTYQSGRRVVEAAVDHSFDVAILDEAHKTVGPRGKAFAALLSDDIEVRHRVFMTATERVLKGGRSEDVLSMDDPEVYGERFYELSFKQAIADGLICDYRILTVTVSDQALRELVEDRRFVDVDGLDEVDAQQLAAGLALKRAVKKRGIKHAISFHRSIRSAVQFAEQQDVLNRDQKLGPRMTNLHISSKNSVAERTELLREFPTYPRSLLTNARCLTEGVDVPEVDCVLFANPKQSVVDIVQAAGRAMRLHEGKNVGYILLPLIVPDGMDLDDFAKTTQFRQVASTITALSTQDERIAEEFRAVDRRPRPSDRIVQFDGDVPVGVSVGLGQFADAIATRIWQRVGRANWRPFDEARAHVRSQNLRSRSDWEDFSKAGRRPPDIPFNPRVTYSGQGWSGWGDWLGTGTLAPRDRVYRPFVEARAFARALGLRSAPEWVDFSKTDERPMDIPATPREVYGEHGWAGWGDWLGTGNTFSGDFLSFEVAREFARSIGIQSLKEWQEFSKSGDRPKDIPSSPSTQYRKQWKGWGDWLGTGRVADRDKDFRDFRSARRLVRKLRLRNNREWRDWSRASRSEDIPSNPERVYADDGWAGWGDWLGTGSTWRSEYLPFHEARLFVRRLGLRSNREWREYSRTSRPPEIPGSPDKAYRAKGWVSWPDWLGTDPRE